MSLNQEERAAIVTYRLEKAERALIQAKANLPFAFVGSAFHGSTCFGARRGVVAPVDGLIEIGGHFLYVESVLERMEFYDHGSAADDGCGASLGTGFHDIRDRSGERITLLDRAENSRHTNGGDRADNSDHDQQLDQGKPGSKRK